MYGFRNPRAPLSTTILNVMIILSLSSRHLKHYSCLLNYACLQVLVNNSIYIAKQLHYSEKHLSTTPCKLFIGSIMKYVHVSRNTDRKRKMLKDEKKHNSAMDESSSEQQIGRSYLCCMKIWTHTPSVYYSVTNAFQLGF